MGGGAHPNERRTFAQNELCSETLRVQYGEDGAARKKSRPAAY